MPLIDRAKLVEMFGAREIDQLAPNTTEGNARLDDAVARTEAEIDSRLGARYQRPLPADSLELAEIAATLTRGRLYAYDRPEWLADEVKAWRKYLDEAGAGARRIQGLVQNVNTAPNATTVETLRGRRDRQFTDRTLKDY